MHTCSTPGEPPLPPHGAAPTCRDEEDAGAEDDVVFALVELAGRHAEAAEEEQPHAEDGEDAGGSHRTCGARSGAWSGAGTPSPMAAPGRVGFGDPAGEGPLGSVAHSPAHPAGGWQPQAGSQPHEDALAALTDAILGAAQHCSPWVSAAPLSPELLSSPASTTHDL